MKSISPMAWIIIRIKKRLPLLGIMIVAHIGSAVLGVMFALGSRQVIDCAIGKDVNDFVRACVLQGMIICGILLCLTIYRHLQQRLSAELDRDWKQQLLRKLLHGNYSSVSHYHSGELINRLNNDVRIVNEGILSAFPGMASMAAKLIAAMAVLIGLQPWFGLILIGVGIAVVIFTGMMRGHLKSLNKRVSEEDGRVSGFLQEVLGKLLIVQAMDVASEVERKAEILMKQRFEIQRKRKNISLIANTGVSVFSYAAGFAALVWSSWSLLNGTMSFGSLTAIVQLVNQLQGPFINLSGFLPKYIAMIASAERLMELEKIDTDEWLPTRDSQELYEQMQTLCVENLEFSYDRNPILQDVSFSIEKGKFVAVTGPSGIGKSTLLKLLLGIFQPNKGEIYIECGNERITIDRTTRRLFAYVPQGNLLFSGTIRENLLVVKPEASESEIEQAVFVSAMDEYLEQLPDGLETVLGENGAGLSEGQLQRLAIARAILGGAPILLLDESTSALDEKTERKVLERIKSLPGKSCIVITHRMTALELCDETIEISKSLSQILSQIEIPSGFD